MKIDYIDDVNSDYLADKMIRISDFTNADILDFYNVIQENLIKNKNSVDVSTINFIDLINCELLFTISEQSKGLYENHKNSFICALTLSEYEDMIKFIHPFLNDPSGFQFLIDPVNHIELLLSSGGGW